MNGARDPTRAAQLLGALDAYRPARQAFLAALRLPASNRDPLAEFGEQIVHALIARLHGAVTCADRARPGAARRKEGSGALPRQPGCGVGEQALRAFDRRHRVRSCCSRRSLFTAVLVFPLDNLARICAALGKRHPRQNKSLQFTRRNLQAIRDDPDRFRGFGMRVWLPSLTVNARPS